MLGGLLIGMIETFWSGYISIEYKDIAAFSTLVIVLIFFPTGHKTNFVQILQKNYTCVETYDIRINLLIGLPGYS